MSEIPSQRWGNATNTEQTNQGLVQGIAYIDTDEHNTRLENHKNFGNSATYYIPYPDYQIDLANFSVLRGELVFKRVASNMANTEGRVKRRKLEEKEGEPSDNYPLGFSSFNSFGIFCSPELKRLLDEPDFPVEEKLAILRSSVQCIGVAYANKNLDFVGLSGSKPYFPLQEGGRSNILPHPGRHHINSGRYLIWDLRPPHPSTDYKTLYYPQNRKRDEGTVESKILPVIEEFDPSKIVSKEAVHAICTSDIYAPFLLPDGENKPKVHITTTAGFTQRLILLVMAARADIDGNLPLDGAGGAFESAKRVVEALCNPDSEIPDARGAWVRYYRRNAMKQFLSGMYQPWDEAMSRIIGKSTAPASPGDQLELHVMAPYTL